MNSLYSATNVATSLVLLITLSVEAVEPVTQKSPMPIPQSIQQRMQSAFNPPDPTELLKVRVAILRLPSSNADERRAKISELLNSIDAADSYLSTHPPTGQRSVASVTPPLSTGLPPGIDRAEVKDPKLRAEYEAAIKKNAEIVKASNERKAAEDFRQQFWDDAVSFCASKYSVSEKDQGALVKDVSAFKGSAKLLKEVATSRRQEKR